MKILFVLENYLPHIGGVEVLFMHICESLAKKHDITVITHRIPGTKKKETINGVNVVRISVPGIFSRYFFTFLSLPVVWKYAKDADIIHTTTYTAAPSASFVAALQKKPSVITIHEVIGKNWLSLDEMSLPSRYLHMFLEWLVVSLKFSKYVCVSNSTKKDFESVKKNKQGTVIYNGVDYDFWDRKNCSQEKIASIRKQYSLDGKFVYLFYGRPGISKGLEYLIRAVPVVKSKIENALLVAIVSKDSTYKKQYDQIIRLIKNLNIENNVLILDPVKRSELPNYILSANCVVVPSLTEGFGFAVTESCALGQVVVASDAKSIPEVISGKYLLVQPKDPASITDGIISVYKNKYHISQLKKFLWPDSIKNYEKMYAEICGISSSSVSKLSSITKPSSIKPSSIKPSSISKQAGKSSAKKQSSLKQLISKSSVSIKKKIVTKQAKKHSK